VNDKEKREREAVVVESRSWLKTPYHPEARVKGAGCDCGTFILQVFENVGLIEHIELKHYPSDIASHCAVPMYLMKIKEYAHEVKRDPLTGDIIVYQFPGSLVPHHAAIVIDDEYLIHSITGRGVEISNRKGYKKHEYGNFSFWS
jgi:cell wall-associated NlpC family hydrolase